MKVTILEKDPRLLSNQLDHEASSLFQKKVKNLGIQVKTNVIIQSIKHRDPFQIESVILKEEAVKADLALISTGVRARIELAGAVGMVVIQ